MEIRGWKSELERLKREDIGIMTGVARHSETNELMVVYKALYKSEKFGDRAWWVRPLEMFTGEVKVNGKRVSRFEFVGDD
jgi:hypothetical protein